MSYAAILAHVQPDEALQYRLRAACDVARGFDASITGLAVEMIRAAPFEDGYSDMGAIWYPAMRDLAAESQDTARVQFEIAAADVPKGSSWLTGHGFPAAAIAKASRGADLIVSSRPPAGRNDSYIDASPAELALTSGRPVLVAPSSGASLKAKHIVLAWKDVREARRAMSDAMPFLELADLVMVVEVCSKEDATDAENRTADVVMELKRHGVKAEAKVRIAHLSPGAEILHQAKMIHADLIVSGAYGHSRLGEWAFGGVTHELLAQDEAYVLLSH